MKYSPRMFFSENREDQSSEDEIDKLFGQLLRIEPPPALIDSILAAVARLPLPQEMQSMAWGDVEGLIVHSENQQPS
jgi:hypothetical protein